MEPILELLSLTIALAAAAACVGGATAFHWKRRQDDHSARHVVRLAGEIEGVASGIESDLVSAADDPPCVVFRQRCRDARARAIRALADKGLRVQEREAITTSLLLLHEDHRRIVDLRSEVDRALARKAAGEDRSRVIRFGRAKPSCWPTSSFLTRPSTFS